MLTSFFRNVGSFRSGPPADASQDITFTTAYHENGVTNVIFTRERVTGDPDDVPLDQCVYFLYAWGGSFDASRQVIGYHGTNREASSDLICLPSADICPREWNTINEWCVYMSVTPPPLV